MVPCGYAWRSLAGNLARGAGLPNIVQRESENLQFNPAYVAHDRAASYDRA